MIRRVSRLWPAGFVAAGVVGGHALAYVLAHPHPAARQAMLDETGHGAFGAVAGAAAAMLLASIATLAARHFRASRGGVPFARTFLRFAPFQIAAFALLEMIERPGAPLAVASERTFLIGCALQVVLAAVVAFLARGIAAAAASLARPARPRAPRAFAPASPVGLVAAAIPVTCAGAAGVRGPPSAPIR